jgi:D-mannonate dehydratase
MAEKLEEEEEQIRELSRQLAAIPGNSPEFMLREAREIIRKLSGINMRWNIPELDDFISQRQRELGLGLKSN